MNDKISRFGTLAVWINMIGILLSGLVFPILSIFLTPQPAWVSAEIFAQHFHFLQTGTYFSGFVMLTGLVMLFVALHLLAKTEDRIFSLSALAFIILSVALAFLNYIIQSTFIPYLAMNYRPENASLISALTMSNAGSLGWSLEMWVWGLIGVGYIFAVPLFKTGKIEKAIRTLFLIDGIGSLLAAVVTAYDLPWVYSASGLAMMVAWNSLMLVIGILLLRYFARLKS